MSLFVSPNGLKSYAFIAALYKVEWLMISFPLIFDFLSRSVKEFLLFYPIEYENGDTVLSCVVVIKYHPLLLP